MARVCRYSEGELVDYIRREILAGKYKPREHLVEKELSDRYHVSRTPIREALTQLEAMGLVVREKHKGAMVADIDLKTIHEMQQVRACLEGMIARLAANRLVEEDLAILERYVSKMEQAAADLDIDEYTRNNNAFHSYLSNCCGNSYLVESHRSIMQKTVHRPCRTWEGLGNVQRTNQSHRSILAALQRRDPIEAQEAATQHVLDALETQKNFLSMSSFL
ncbi:MAG: GntR family transcriptional regulator [Candidatus Limiplasma sp.]|nr:GntR family transcriptional regulator [Candidatus Limiplasma sp.]